MDRLRSLLSAPKREEKERVSSFHQRAAVCSEACKNYCGARERSQLGALLTLSPAELHRLTVLSHPRLASKIMDGNG